MKKSPQQQSSKPSNSKSKDITVAIPPEKAAGAAAGAVVGGVVAGPIGAVVGGVVGTMMAGNTDKVKKAVASGAKTLAKKSTVVKSAKKAVTAAVEKTKAVTGLKKTAIPGKPAAPKAPAAKKPAAKAAAAKSRPAPKAVAKKPVVKKPAPKSKPVAAAKKTTRKG